ncbi:MAG: MBG domain-containing protein, partial [Clostridia bacterium]
ALDITGNYTYNGLEQTPTYTLKNNAILLTINIDFTATLSNNKNAGTATLTLTGKGNYSGSIGKTFTIAKASLTITANAETITYGDSAPTYTAIYDGFVNGETLAVLDGSITGTYTIGSGISSISNVYTITPSFTSANYSITQKTATLTVNARNIIIALTAQSGYTGAIWEKSLSNSDVSNVISGHSFSGTLQTTSANVNTYTCNPTDLTLTNFKWKSDYDIKDNNGNGISVKNNYNITYNLKVIIERGAINFSITDGSSVYDGAWHNSSITVDSPNCAVGYSTDSATEKVYVATAPTFKNAGTHTVYYRVYGTTPEQYNESIGEITLKITPKALTVKANALTITYGDPAPTYTATFSGFVNGETLAVLGGNLTFACA